MDEVKYLENFCKEAGQKGYAQYHDEYTAIELRGKILNFLTKSERNNQELLGFVKKVVNYRKNHSKKISLNWSFDRVKGF